MTAIVCLLLTILALSSFHFAQAQEPKKVLRIGYLTTATAITEMPRFDAFRHGLSRLGYVEGQNVTIEFRHTDGKFERLVDLAKDLVRLDVDVLVTVSTNAALAAKSVTKTTPIFFMGVADPVSAGLVESLSRPGGNITGLTIIAPPLAGKRLDLLRESIPKLSRVAVLWDSKAAGSVPQWKESELAATKMGLQLHSAEVTSPDQLDHAIKEAKARTDALSVTLSPLAVSNQRQIGTLAANYRLPAIHPREDFVANGGLMSYGPNFPNEGLDGARLVAKIVKGTKPAEIPVEQPTKFELVVNLIAAKQLGLTMPPNVLARADKVIR